MNLLYLYPAELLGGAKEIRLFFSAGKMPSPGNQPWGAFLRKVRNRNPSGNVSHLGSIAFMLITNVNDGGSGPLAVAGLEGECMKRSNQ